MCRPLLFVAATLGVSSLLSPVATAQVLLHEPPGPSAVVALPDLDADGVAELATGDRVAGLVRVISGADGSVLMVFTGSGAFGAALAAPGDLDGDGVPDLAVGAPQAGRTGGEGALHLLSLGTGETLAVVPGGGAADHLGSALAVLPDLDGDGVAELAVGAPQFLALGQTLNGRVLVVSGGSGALLAELAPSGLPEDHDLGRFGHALANVGDLDGDGVADLAVGMPCHGLAPQPGRVFVYSLAGLLDPGASTPLLELLGGATGFGSAVVGLGDLDGDGVPDLAVGAPEGLGPGQPDPGALLLSGQDGHVVRTLSPGEPTPGFGSVLAAPGDLDGDGVPDVLAGGSGNPFGADLGRVLGMSGASGAVLFELLGVSSPEALFASSLAALGDLTGDGVSEFAVGDGQAGSQRVYSALGVWTDLGWALGGASGTPALSGAGQLLGDDAVQLSLVGGPPSAPGVLMFGFGQVTAPFLGGVMVPETIAVLDGLLTDAGGEWGLHGRWPAGFPSATLYVQAWFADASGPQGAVSSNGLAVAAP